jgi:hypothetical protein
VGALKTWRLLKERFPRLEVGGINMAAMARILHDLNDLIGVFLFIVCLGVGSCAKALADIKRELECLHDDFDSTHGAHVTKDAQARAKYGV